LLDVRARSLRGRRRVRARADLRWLHRRRQPQRGLGDLLGRWAGRGAAELAARIGKHAATRNAKPLGEAALCPAGARTLDPNALVREVQAEVLPFERNRFRTQRGLSDSLERLNALWREARRSAPENFAREVLRGREAAAMLARARFMYETARERTETRGMHEHLDYPELDGSQQRRLVTGGLDRVWVRPEAGSSIARASERRSNGAARSGVMIELASEERCVRCDICVEARPTNVFDAVPDATPVIARQEDCQTCFMCELYCPADALFGAPEAEAANASDEAGLVEAGLLGSHRAAVGWGPASAGRQPRSIVSPLAARPNHRSSATIDDDVVGARFGRARVSVRMRQVRTKSQ
jgi:NAD-dependent dihydropyrimidine dehydrogenase PreA subunit